MKANLKVLLGLLVIMAMGLLAVPALAAQTFPESNHEKIAPRQACTLWNTIRSSIPVRNKSR